MSSSSFDFSNLIDFDDTTVFTTTLTQANKYLDKLKTYLSSTKSEEDEFVKMYNKPKKYEIPVFVDVQHLLNLHANTETANNKKIEEEVTNYVNNKKNECYRRKNISLDIVKLKNSIFRANSLNGIDEILSSISYLTELKNDYQKILLKTKETSVNSLIASYARDSNKSSSFQNYSINLWSTNDITSKIKNINKLINKLEMDRDMKNATNNVTFNLSTSSIDIIGL
jgi:hypothetical protein